MRNLLRSGILITLFIALIGAMACGGEDFVDVVDPDIQLEIDVALIEEYLSDNGYTDYDTLDTETRLVILDGGEGDAIEFGDIVTFDYVGMFLNDSIFDTTVDSLSVVTDANGENEITLDVSNQVTTTHSPGGWFFQQSGFIEGFKDGVVNTLDQVQVSGTGLMLIPSQAAYGRIGTGEGGIPGNSVLLFKVRPVIAR